MPTTEDLQQEINDFKESTDKTVEVLRLEISELQNKRSLDRYLDNESKEIITDVNRERFLDVFWESYFFYNTFFEGTAGFNITGDVVIDGGGCLLRSPGSGSGLANINTNAGTDFPGGFTFTKESRIRFPINFGTDSNQSIEISCGDMLGDAYGFIVTDSTLVGFAQTAPGSRTTLNILTIAIGTKYTLEARFSPGNSVEFFINNESRGSISSDLPITSGDKLWEVEVNETEAVVKSVTIGSVDFALRVF